MGVKERIASTTKAQQIASKIFSGSNLKTKDGEIARELKPGETYLLYSKESDKKIGWVKMPDEPNQAGTGWINLPAYLRLPDPVEQPFDMNDFAVAPLDEYDIPYGRDLPDNVPDDDLEDPSKDVENGLSIDE